MLKQLYYCHIEKRVTVYVVRTRKYWIFNSYELMGADSPVLGGAVQRSMFLLSVVNKTSTVERERHRKIVFSLIVGKSSPRSRING